MKRDLAHRAAAVHHRVRLRVRFTPQHRVFNTKNQPYGGVGETVHAEKRDGSSVVTQASADGPREGYVQQRLLTRFTRPVPSADVRRHDEPNEKHEERQAPDAEPRVEDCGDPIHPVKNKTKHVVSLIVPI